nr:hypothetical protein [Micromonospora sp. DSM 115978]
MTPAPRSTPLDMDDRFHGALYDLAWSRGPGPAITRLHGAAGPGVLLCGPTGHALAPTGLAAAAASLRAGSGLVPRDADAEVDLTTPALRNLDLVAIRRRDLPPAGTADHGPTGTADHGPTGTADHGPTGTADHGPTGTADHGPIGVAVTWLRLGLVNRLVDACVDYLGERTSAGQSLLHHQLVRADLADAVISRMEVEAGLGDLDPGGSPDLAARLVDLHATLDRTGRELLRLLGASGFTAAGAGRLAYVSELLGDVYGTTGEVYGNPGDVYGNPGEQGAQP